MRTLKMILPLFLLTVAMIGCEKPEKEKTSLRTLQRANVRMEIKSKVNSTKTNVGIVGDSVSVKRLARWGIELRTQFTERVPAPELVGLTLAQPLDADNGSAFWRDTIACIYIFGFTSVFDYKVWGTVPGEPDYGIPGTEEPSWLMTSANPVFVAAYDTVRQRYYDPMIKSYLDSTTGLWVYPDSYWIDARYDTLGYIPQRMMEVNYDRLWQLFHEERYDEMIEVMQTGYTIYTCTGEEYRELVRLGLN